MKTGLVVGKFYPPHKGHSYLIQTAQANSDKVIVMIADRPEFKIPAKLRAKWLQEAHPEVEIRLFEDKLDDNDSRGWGANTLKFLGIKPDVVFSSENYGEPYAAAMKTKHFSVDPPRETVACSATQIRHDPYRMWDYLSPGVKSYLALRVCLVGAESTGKTTLSKALAEYYDTNWVPEYGRLYTEENISDVFSHKWTNKEFIHIAKRQNEMEDDYARTCNKILVCDTDSFATSIWYERYFGVRSSAVEKLAARRNYDLYILTSDDIPFEQDGWRDGENIRHWMHQRFIEKLQFWGKDYLLVSGDPRQRLELASQKIDQLLTINHRLAGRQLDNV